MSDKEKEEKNKKRHLNELYGQWSKNKPDIRLNVQEIQNLQYQKKITLHEILTRADKKLHNITQKKNIQPDTIRSLDKDLGEFWTEAMSIENQNPVQPESITGHIVTTTESLRKLFFKFFPEERKKIASIERPNFSEATNYIEKGEFEKLITWFEKHTIVRHPDTSAWEGLFLKFLDIKAIQSNNEIWKSKSETIILAFNLLLQKSAAFMSSDHLQNYQDALAQLKS